VLVAIVGRPNVGKSTLFNRLTGSRQAIVEDTPGVTRDRVYGEAEWKGHTIPLVDTGGYVPRSDDPYERAIREQAEIALEDADVILFVVDVTTGITEMDKEIATVLRPTETPVMVVANKADNEEREWDASEFYQLGLGEVYPVSSTNKRGVDDMMAALVEELPGTEEEADKDRVQVSLVGKPNAGKSSLVNATLGFDRAIVTERPGTTRDTVQSVVQYEGRDLMLVDTAGMQKRSKADGVEFYATVRSERAIRAGDVCVLVLDATEELHTGPQRRRHDGPVHEVSAAVPGHARPRAHRVRVGRDQTARVRAARQSPGGGGGAGDARADERPERRGPGGPRRKTSPHHQQRGVRQHHLRHAGAHGPARVRVLREPPGGHPHRLQAVPGGEAAGRARV
jgi:small GTP-binding protein